MMSLPLAASRRSGISQEPSLERRTPRAGKCSIRARLCAVIAARTLPDFHICCSEDGSTRRNARGGGVSCRQEARTVRREGQRGTANDGGQPPAALVLRLDARL